MKEEIMDLRNELARRSSIIEMKQLQIEMIDFEMDRIVDKDLSDETIVEAVKRLSEMVKIFRDWRF